MWCVIGWFWAVASECCTYDRGSGGGGVYGSGAFSSIAVIVAILQPLNESSHMTAPLGGGQCLTLISICPVSPACSCQPYLISKSLGV